MSEAVVQTSENIENDKYLVFRVGSSFYGISLSEIVEVTEKLETVPTPNSPDHVLGVVNLRGEVITVVDTRMLLGQERSESQLNFVIVVNTNKGKVAALVDQMIDVRQINSEIIEGPHSTAQSEANVYLKGIAKADDHLIYILRLKDFIQEALSKKSKGEDHELSA